MLTDFSTLDTDEIMTMVQEIWQKESTLKAVQEAIEGIPPSNKKELPPNVDNFLNSIKVDQLKMMEGGGRLTPHYNIYANAMHLQNHTMWTKARGVLTKLYYGTTLLGAGIPIIKAHHCNICHGADHPRGFCPFARLQGWRGRGPDGMPDAAHKSNDIHNMSPLNTQRC